MSKFLILLTATLLTLNSWAATDNSKHFTLRIPGEPETLDWNRAHTPIETYILLNLMEGLVSFDSKMKVTPALAEKWNISPDGKTYTFTLRKGVKWSDGVPLKAADFVFSWKRLLTPMTAAAYAYFLYDVEGAEAFNKGTLKDFSQVGIKALNESTLQVKLTQPISYWIQIPTFWVTFPLREDIVQKHGSDWERPGRMVTAGPYMLVTHDIDSKIVLKANPHYYGKRGNIDTITAQVVRDATTAVTLYESGKIDFLTDISTIEIKRYQNKPDLKSFPYLKVAYMGFAINNYPVDQVKVRRAISMAIDRSKFGDLLFGDQKKASTFVPPGIPAYSAQLGLPYDPIKAKAELDKSGVSPGTPLEIDLLVSNWDKPLMVAQYIQSELKKHLNIILRINPYDNKTFRAQIDLKTSPLFLTSWSADYPDADNFLSVFQSTAGNNRTSWKSPSFDNLVKTGRATLDRVKRKKLYLQAQKTLIEDEAIILPLYYEPQLALLKPRVKGLNLNPLNYLLLKDVMLSP